MIKDRSNVVLQPVDQGYSYLCGLYSAAIPYKSAGYNVQLAPAYQAVRGYPLVFPGDPCGFDDVLGYINHFANQSNTFVQFFNGDGKASDLATVDQLVRDNWFVIAGFAEWDLRAGQNYYHFTNLNGFDGTNIILCDSYKNEDGVPLEVPVTAVHNAMADNWDNLIDAVAFKIVTKD